ncbi:hypothetical protein ABKV19_012629 [Rosa sericea]
MAFLRSVATTSAIAASLLPAAIALSSSSSPSQSSRFPKPQNLSFLSSFSSPNPKPLFLATSLTDSPSALHMDAPTSEHKPSFQSDAVLPELLTEYMVDMKCESCVKAVKNKLQVVDDFLVSAAVAEFKGPDVFGVVRFAQVNMELARIEANFSGLSPGKHGWSINEFGDLTKGAASTGKVFNPSTEGVNEPLGDLGTLDTDENGNAFFSGVKEKLRVSDLIGRSIAVYGTADKSDSGVAAAVIARSAGVGENYKTLCTCDGTTIWESSDKDFVKSKV